MQENTRQRFELLDLLRFIAAVLILFHHYQQVFGIRFSNINFWGGRINVGFLTELFFMISGFLTVMSTKGKPQGYWSIRNCLKAWLHRMVRIYPMAVLACLSYLMMAYLYRRMTGAWPDDLCDYSDLKTIAASLLLLFCGIPGLYMIGINNPAWYLCILLLCYHVFFFIKFLTDRYRLREIWFFAGMILLAEYGLKIRFVWIFFMGNARRGYIAFFLGVLLAVICARLKRNTVKKICKALDAVTVLSALALLISGRWEKAVELQYQLEVYYLYPLLLLNIFSFDNIEYKPIRRLGEISFEIYLWHAPMFVFLKIVLAGLAVPLPEGPVIMILTALTVTLWAIPMAYCLEKPLAAKLRLLL